MTVLPGQSEVATPWVLVKWVALVLFYGYGILLALAGFFGAVFAPADFDIVIGYELSHDDPRARIDLLSQYRFLRAIEFGAGVFVLWYRKEVFTSLTVNRLFMTLLAAGISARILSLFVEGNPSSLYWFFLLWEGAGLISIFVYTRRTGFPQP